MTAIIPRPQGGVVRFAGWGGRRKRGQAMKLDGIRKTLHQVNKIRYRPVLMGRIAQAYFRSLVLRQPTLRIMEFSINTACQSRCDYCYAAKFRRRGDTLLEVEEIAEVWGQARRLGAFAALLLGGEPTLHPRLLDILRVLEPRKNIVSFATNSISLTEDMVVEMKKLGIFVLYVSMNSVDAEKNDAVRGYRGHLDHVMRVLDLCRKHGLDVVLPITTSKPLLADTIELLDFSRKNGFTANIGLFAPTGRAEGRHEELFDDEFWKTLRELYDRNPGLRGDWDTNLTLEVGCPAGYEKLHVSPYGDVTGCSLQPVSFGNVRETPLTEIVAKMRGFRHFEKRAPSCIMALDREFIGDYVDFSMQHPSTPYPVELNPHWEADCGGRVKR